MYNLNPKAMKNIIILLIALSATFTLTAQRYSYFSERKGEIIKTDGSSFVVNNLTLMYWKMSMGRVVDYYGTSKLKAKDVEIDINKVQSIEFIKEDDGPEYINFYANIKLKSGGSGRFLINRVYNNGQNNPHYSFVGKNDFGIIDVKIWDVKKVLYN